MFTLIKTNFKEGNKTYQYIPGADHVVVYDHTKYGSPIVKYLKEGGIYEMLKNNHETRVLVQTLVTKRSEMNDDVVKIVNQLRH